jgi:hypothetical protein
MLTNEQIEAKLNAINNRLLGLTTNLERTNAELLNKTNNSALNRTSEELRELIRQTAIDVNTLNEKLGKIILPEETRMYLDAGEVQDFQSNFNALKAMMVKFDKLYKNLVAYTSNLDS